MSRVGLPVIIIPDAKVADHVVHVPGWWNYFQLGLDFLVADEDGGQVIKIMIHSNIVSCLNPPPPSNSRWKGITNPGSFSPLLHVQPGSALFQRYARCPWHIHLPSGVHHTFTDSIDVVSRSVSQISELEGDLFEASEASEGSSSSGKNAKVSSSGISSRHPFLTSSDGEIPMMTFDRSAEPGFELLLGIGPSRKFLPKLPPSPLCDSKVLIRLYIPRHRRL